MAASIICLIILSLCDHFLWDLQSRVYKTKPRNLVDFRRRILEEAAFISNDYNETVSSFYEYTIKVNSGQFK